MPKRLLILCDGFGRPLYGPRMTQLCKHLNQRGWQITLLTEQIETPQYVVPGCTFHSMVYYRGGRIRTKIQWVLDKLFGRKEHTFYRFVRRHIRTSEYDVILCSAFNDFPLRTATRIAQETNLPLVVDLRDIAEQWGTDSYMIHHLGMGQIGKRLTRWYQQRAIAIRNRALRVATAVTTVSPWHCQMLRSYNSNVHLIYNGYDADVFYPAAIPAPTFIISYIGRIYDLTFRNPQILLQAVAELWQQNLIEQQHFRIVFHIEPYIVPVLRDMTQQMGIDCLCHIEGYIPHQEAQKIQQQSAISVVLLQAETTQGSHGIMTTKFFEALGCEKPVLCIPSSHGCLAQTIRETHAGIATANVEEIKTFILEKYHEWQANGYTRQNVQNKEPFSRAYQAQQFETLFLQCTRQHP